VAKVSKKKKRKKQESASALENVASVTATKTEKPESFFGKLWAWLNDQN
jgi:hypothetical protein